MAKLLPEHVLERIREATDIVELVSDYLPLRKSGRSFKALCPFHEDKNPSFSVNPERQTFYCFGCGKGGDVFAFVMEQDRLSFPEALEMLARRAGIEIPKIEREEDRTRLELFRVNQWAEALYNRILLEGPAAARAREYLEKRGFGPEVQQRFRLGYAPGRNTLVQHAHAEGLRAELLVQAGLARRGERSSLSDYFFGRIMFPIRDVRGRTVGFGGRTVDGSEPKYINTAETEVFNKGRLLYGLDVARGEVRRKENVFLTEGYTDVLMAQMNGIENTVAILGTAVGLAHAKILKRYVPRATMVFDADEAGMKALERSAEVFLGQDLDVYVVELPKESDLCSFIAEKGVNAFEERASACENFVPYSLRKAGSMRGRLEVVKKLARFVGKIPDPIRRDAYLVEISRGSDVSLESLRGGIAVEKVRPSSPVAASGQLRMTPERFAVEAVLSGKVPVGMVIEETQDLEEKDIEDSVEGRLLRKLLGMVRKEEAMIDVSRALSEAADDVERQIIMGTGEGAPELDYEQQFRYSIEKMRARSRRRTTESLRGRMRDAKAAGDDEKLFELLAEYNRLTVESAKAHVEG